MKKLFFGILLVSTFFSCSNDDEQTEDIDTSLIIGQWNLSKIINNSIGGTTTPEEDDTHFYQINENGTFTRTAIENNTSNDLQGTYIVTSESSLFGNEDNTNQRLIELSYTSSEVRFLNCGFDEQKQILILTSENKLQNTLGGACDGDSYEYEKEN